LVVSRDTKVVPPAWQPAARLHDYARGVIGRHAPLTKNTAMQRIEPVLQFLLIATILVAATMFLGYLLIEQLSVIPPRLAAATRPPVAALSLL
jgi:hypothetical protein